MRAAWSEKVWSEYLDTEVDKCKTHVIRALSVEQR